MSAAGRPVPPTAGHDALPRFELDYGVDDRREPAEITVYDPSADDVTTRWLTADVEATVDLSDVA